ncbi:hypothetical protein THIOSC15_2350002 [uncultured Thiomicrorhabdus sp.]
MTNITRSPGRASRTESPVLSPAWQKRTLASGPSATMTPRVIACCCCSRTTSGMCSPPVVISSAPVNIVNTIFNQLLDAGTLANRQGGFGPGIRLKPGGGHGSVTFQQGEWKQIGFLGDDIRRQVFALPVKEPSTVLFQLLGLMLEAVKELASQADVLTGEHPKGNVCNHHSSTHRTGIKVFSAIYKRVYLALKSEFKKIRRLNYLYLTDFEYNNIIDYTDVVTDPQTGQQATQQLTAFVKEDYGDQFMDIIPVSGSADVSDPQRIIKAGRCWRCRATTGSRSKKDTWKPFRYRIPQSCCRLKTLDHRPIPRLLSKSASSN